MSEQEINDKLQSISENEKEALLTDISKILYLNSKSKGVLDALQEKVISRKLLVFLTATGLLAWSNLDPETWGLIAVIYIGGQAVIDAVKAWRHG